jgi:hypothetical protein
VALLLILVFPFALVLSWDPRLQKLCQEQSH